MSLESTIECYKSIFLKTLKLSVIYITQIIIIPTEWKCSQAEPKLLVSIANDLHLRCLDEIQLQT